MADMQQTPVIVPNQDSQVTAAFAKHYPRMAARGFNNLLTHGPDIDPPFLRYRPSPCGGCSSQPTLCDACAADRALELAFCQAAIKHPRAPN